MSTNLVIVAIPEETDRVWKLSSEPVPHLTLLFLGDVANIPHTGQIAQFVEHAVTLSEHGPFYLDIDHRGKLGDAEADVLFFNKRSWNLKWIKQFRGQLLQNQQIRTAYDSTPQHMAPQDWVPHLTMGYPDTPAKEPPPENDYPLYSVCFDRIAVWIEDFNGPEFRLEWPEREDMSNDVALAYSATQKAAIAHQLAVGPVLTAAERGQKFLEHHGVKGMKWGVTTKRGRNAEIIKSVGPKLKSGVKKIGRGFSRAADALGEHFYEQSIYSSAVHESIHNQVAKELDDKLYRLQAAPKYRGKNLKADKALETEYHQDVAKVTDAAYRRAVKDHIGENTKGTKEARYVEDARGARIEIRNKQTGEKVTESDLTSVQQINADKLNEANILPQGNAAGAGLGTSRFKHAATDTPAIDLPDIVIPLKLDSNGQVKSIGYVKSESTAIDHGEAFAEGLMHYGVKGMHWGQRTAIGGGSAAAFRRSSPPEAVAPHAESKVPHGKRRKTKVEVDGGENQPAHTDAIKVAEAQAKLHKSGPKALSNQELREVAQRVQLEQQAIQATRPSASRFVRQLLSSQGKQAANEAVKAKIQKTTNSTKKK